MTERKDVTNEIRREDVDWEKAAVREGQQSGTVVSVRLNSSEAERLRGFAEASNLTLSQVLRRALTEYEPSPKASPARWAIEPMTRGGLDWSDVLRELILEPPRGESKSGTRPVRIREKVPAY